MDTKEIRKLLVKRENPGGEGPGDASLRREIAAAALLVECARINGEFGEEEHRAIRRILRERLGLDTETVEGLIGVAEQRADEVWDDWIFTETIRRGFDETERSEIVARLWEVAYADQVLHRFEERLITRIARELGVSKEDLEQAKARAQARMKGDEVGSHE